MKQKFQEIWERQNESRRKQERVFFILGGAKFLLLFGFFALCYVVYRADFSPLSLSLAGGGFALLVLFWVLHNRVHRALRQAKAVMDAARRYLDRMEGSWIAFADKGADCADAAHPYGMDLDMVGDASLFQLLNVTGSWHGRQRLAADLLRPQYTGEQVLRRQEAVAELSGMAEFACRFQSETGQIGTDDSIPKAVEALQLGKRFLSSRVLRAAVVWLAPGAAAAALLSLALPYPALKLASGAWMALHLLLWALGLMRCKGLLDPLTRAPHSFGRYTKAITLLAETPLHAPLLRELQQETKAALPALKQLDSIASKTQIKGNGILYFVLNALLLWDFRCAVRLDSWKARYGTDCENWFVCFGELESLLSLAVLPCVCEGCCRPEITAGESVLRAVNIGHPLLGNGQRVCNDFALEQEIGIISGSNMSGKTTFLRTVGINLVLANAGGLVCAASLQCTLFDVLTSMRIADDLSGGISTFYAELKRIAAILARAKSGEKRARPVFFLIDEIFRGTNSEDRLYGARQVLLALQAQGAAGLITTHDLALCDLDKESKSIVNYSFSERYEKDEMFFTYRLQQGRSVSTNAKFLMKQIGIDTINK